MHTALLEQLYAHQAEVRSAIAEALALLARADAPAIAHGRLKLTRALTAYQLFKHQRIFDWFARHGTSEEAHAARQLKIEWIATGETFRAFLARGIEGREAEHAREAQGMMTLLDRHIQSERRDIEALLATEKRAA
ncbi:MAG: hypothetical protein EOP61_23250 [Sphingomonadales bacterium]|nr:MAG: hypothetical protein EOP61_23250 [Sphingomonadales bacterium]